MSSLVRSCLGFGDVPATEVLGHVLERDVDIYRLTVVLHLTHPLMVTWNSTCTWVAYFFIGTGDVRLVRVVRHIDLVAILRAAWKSHLCSSLLAMAVQFLAL